MRLRYGLIPGILVILLLAYQASWGKSQAKDEKTGECSYLEATINGVPYRFPKGDALLTVVPKVASLGGFTIYEVKAAAGYDKRDFAKEPTRLYKNTKHPRFHLVFSITSNDTLPRDIQIRGFNDRLSFVPQGETEPYQAFIQGYEDAKGFIRVERIDSTTIRGSFHGLLVQTKKDKLNKVKVEDGKFCFRLK